MKKELSTSQLMKIVFDCREMLWIAYEFMENQGILDAYIKTSQILVEMHNETVKDEKTVIH